MGWEWSLVGWAWWVIIGGVSVLCLRTPTSPFCRRKKKKKNASDSNTDYGLWLPTCDYQQEQIHSLTSFHAPNSPWFSLVPSQALGNCPLRSKDCEAYLVKLVFIHVTEACVGKLMVGSCKNLDFFHVNEVQTFLATNQHEYASSMQRIASQFI